VSGLVGRHRWVAWPEGVRDVPGGGLPQSFRAAGVAAGIKASGDPDVGLLVCDAVDATSAARFTRSSTVAAPVLVTRKHAKLGALRAVVVNSGNANAATGGRGRDDAAKMQGIGAMACGVAEDRVAVCSTGVIGVPLDTGKVTKGCLAARGELAQDGDGAFQRAIMTTDAFEKRATLEVDLPSGTVRMSAQTKGAGMIQPAFATMLCFVQTDAAVPAEVCDALLGRAVRRSFDRISVDGQLSTNDTAILMASGASGVAVAAGSEDEAALAAALDALLRALALEIARDGEGARRIGRVVVRGGDQQAAEHAARAVANSPLVKAALHGGDPNWGRIVQAVGAALPGEPLAVDVTIEGVPVCVAGARVPFDEADLAGMVDRPEVEYEIGLPGEGAEAEVLFSDLSHEYVTINADYTT
jgi:glutamate N-acetyltransferase / amino-acid N-acetyltransferase